MVNSRPLPEQAGPQRNGAKSLAKESKAGIAVGFLVTVLGNGALEWLTQLDTESWSGRWAQIGVAAVGTAIALITAYLKKNR